MAIRVGDRLPEASFKIRTADGLADLTTAQIFPGKKVVLFGSYGWGGGEWMDIWKRDNAGLNIVDTVICQDAPDDDALAACRAAADKLA